VPPIGPLWLGKDFDLVLVMALDYILDFLFSSFFVTVTVSGLVQ